MTGPSALTTTAFVLVVAVVYALLVLAARRASLSRAQGMRALLGVLFAYLLVPGVLAALGALDRYAPPPPALLLVAALTIATVLLARSPIGARLASGIPMAGLVGFQAFRIPVELVLHRLYAEGVIPAVMTYEGWNYDIATGAIALVLAVALAGGRPLDGFVRAWNVLGLLLLGTIVVIAVLSTPTPFRQFLEGPPNTLPSVFPYVWLPSFLVQAALFGHLLVFRALRARR